MCRGILKYVGLWFLLFSPLLFAQGNGFGGSGIAVGNCIAGQTRPGYLRAKSQIIGSKYFYIGGSEERKEQCRKSLRDACLYQVQTWIEQGIISHNVLKNTSEFYWYVHFERFSCTDIDDTIDSPVGEPIPSPDLDRYVPDWKNVTKLYEHINDPWLSPELIPDFIDLINDIYDNAPLGLILAVGGILFVLFGVKTIEGLTGGPLAAEPITIFAALTLILAIALSSGFLEQDNRHERYKKYLSHVDPVSIDGDRFVFDEHEFFDYIEINTDQRRWTVQSKEYCKTGTEGNKTIIYDSDC